MKTIYAHPAGISAFPAAFALLTMVACGTKSGPDADNASAPDTTSAAQASEPPSADIPTHTQEATADGPAVTFDDGEHLDFQDLQMQSDGKAYYRGHPYNGSAWMDMDHVVRRTFSNGVATVTKAYHSTGAEAATLTRHGELTDCHDAAGQSISSADFAERYPDFYAYLLQMSSLQ